MAKQTTFPAEVTISGDTEAGDMEITITQVEANGGEPGVPPIEPEPPKAWEPPAWLIRNTNLYEVPQTPKPAYLETIEDPTFKTKLTRVTGDPGTAVAGIAGMTWGNEARHHYNSDQSWNCDQSLFYIDHNRGTGASGPTAVFLDGATYEPLFVHRNKPSGSDVRWHPTNPNLMHYAHQDKIGEWNPDTGTIEVIEAFGSAYTDLTFGPWKWCFDLAGDSVVLSGRKESRDVAFVYRLSTGRRERDVFAQSLSTNNFSSVGISPTGTYMVWQFSPDITIVTDLEGQIINTLVSNTVSHGDMMLDTGGDENIVGRVNSGSLGFGPSGRIGKFRLRDTKHTQLSGGGWCSHTSTRGTQNRRWCVADAFDNPTYPPYRGEIIMCALTGSAVFRICHHQNSATPDYVSQCQATMSPDSGRVAFASSWRATGSVPRPVGCYIADFRE